ncbi:hypothetical protein CEXT_336531, partial [Caerostris extrusa]
MSPFKGVTLIIFAVTLWIRTANSRPIPQQQQPPPQPRAQQQQPPPSPPREAMYGFNYMPEYDLTGSFGMVEPPDGQMNQQGSPTLPGGMYMPDGSTPQGEMYMLGAPNPQGGMYMP